MQGPASVTNPSSKARYQPTATRQQRSAIPAGETQKVQSQETHHSTEDLYAAAPSQEETMPLLEEVTNPQETPKRMDRKERIK